jgi:hypothetical protein
MENYFVSNQSLPTAVYDSTAIPRLPFATITYRNRLNHSACGLDRAKEEVPTAMD